MTKELEVEIVIVLVVTVFVSVLEVLEFELAIELAQATVLELVAGDSMRIEVEVGVEVVEIGGKDIVGVFLGLPIVLVEEVD